MVLGNRGDKMIGLMVIGLIVLIVGKVRVTGHLLLVGRKARWYGAFLILTAIPFGLLVGNLIVLVTPEALLGNPVGRRVINYSVLIAYLILLAIPFRERAETRETRQPSKTCDATSESAPGADSSAHQG